MVRVVRGRQLLGGRIMTSLEDIWLVRVGMGSERGELHRKGDHILEFLLVLFLLWLPPSRW